MKYLFFVLISFNALSSDIELLRYKVKKGDSLGSVLNNLGACPLWGNEGNVKKVSKLNPNIVTNSLKVNSEILIPYEYISKIDKVIFLKNRFLIPRAENQNLCDDFID